MKLRLLGGSLHHGLWITSALRRVGWGCHPMLQIRIPFP